MSSDIEQLRILLGKRTEELREARASQENSQGTLLQQRQILRGLVMRMETLVNPVKENEKSSHESEQLLQRLGSLIGILELEHRSKVSMERRRLDTFLAQLGKEDPRPVTSGEAELKLAVAEAELSDALSKLAVYEAWEKDLGNLRETKLALAAHIEQLRPSQTPQQALPDTQVVTHAVTEYFEISCKCRICLTQMPDTLIFPCMHRLFCNQCAASLSACPLCSSSIQGKLHLPVDQGLIDLQKKLISLF